MKGAVVVRVAGICGGQFTIVGHAITVETVCRRWCAGEDVRGLARDYGLRAELVEAAIRWAANAGELQRWRHGEVR